MIVLLRDTSSSNVDAVIMTKKTSSNEIQDIIDEVKEKWEADNYEEDLLNMIENALPNDCELNVAWSMDFNSVWY